MIQQTLAQIKAQIKTAETIGTDQKSELLDLLNSLQDEISELPPSQSETANSITKLTAISTREATQPKRAPHLLELSIEDLTSSVKSLETSHPKLVEVVNSICVMLSDLGI
jgi:hypothetical protein